MTGEQEEIISANPETCHIEGEGSHGNVYIQRKFDVKFAQEESCASDQYVAANIRDKCLSRR